MKGLPSGRSGQSSEDYLKAIFTLTRDQEQVSTTSLAEELQVTPAAVSQAVRQLAAKKLVRHEPYYGVRLTKAGRAKALEMVRHHRLLEVFLHDILGYSWDEVDEEAEHLEHHISEKFVARIDRLLNYPSFDPHGEPIPSSDGDMPEQVGKYLSDCEVGQTLEILWVRDIPEVLQFLDHCGIRPGKRVEVRDRQPLEGPLILRIGRRDHVVGREVADCVFVRPAVAGQALGRAPR